MVRLIGLVISAFLFAIGGILFGHYLGTLAVSIYWLDMTFLTLAMLVVGGMRSLTGAVVGTLAISAVRELLRANAVSTLPGAPSRFPRHAGNC